MRHPWVALAIGVAAAAVVGGSGSMILLAGAGSDHVPEGRAEHRTHLSPQTTLDPSDRAPRIARDDAVRMAEQSPAAPDRSRRPTAATATYGLFTDTQNQDAQGTVRFQQTLAWVITWDDVAVTALGPADADRSGLKGVTCPFRVVLDGDTGTELESFQSCSPTVTESASPTPSQ